MKRILTLLLCAALLSGAFSLLAAASSEQGTQSDTQTAAQDAAMETTLPLTASYVIIDGSHGCGTGTFYMTLPDNCNATSYALYWGDASGNRLPGYSAFYPGKITANYVLISTRGSFTAPSQTKSILVYTYSEQYGESTTGFRAQTDLTGLTMPRTGKKIAEFVVVSDTHVGRDKASQAQFTAMLKDVKAISPSAAGIFIVGSAVDAAEDEYYELLGNLYTKEGGLPPLHRAVGTHEFLDKELYLYDTSAHAANLQKFFKYVKHPGGSSLTTPYYTFFLGGCTMIVLGADAYQDGKAVYSQDQLSWLSAVLGNTASDKPIFVLMHEPLPDTVSGTLASQGYKDVQNAEKIKDILDQYPNVVLFCGHTHRSMQEARTAYQQKDGFRTFNAASVSFLWADGESGGYEIPGSQGYYVTVYENAVLVRGRDFAQGEWIGQAEFLFSTKQPEPQTTAPTTAKPAATTKAPEQTEPEEDKTSLRDLIPAMAVLAIVVMVVFILLFRPTHHKSDET